MTVTDIVTASPIEQHMAIYHAVVDARNANSAEMALHAIGLRRAVSGQHACLDAAERWVRENPSHVYCDDWRQIGLLDCDVEWARRRNEAVAT